MTFPQKLRERRPQLTLRQWSEDRQQLFVVESLRGHAVSLPLHVVTPARRESPGRSPSRIRPVRTCVRGRSRSPHSAFRRALDRRNLTLALAEARDLPVVNLADALELLLLIRDQQPDRYDRASARWLARYCVEVPGVELAEVVLAAGALAALAAPEQRVGGLALVALVRQRRLRDVERVLRRSLSLGSDDAS